MITLSDALNYLKLERGDLPVGEIELVQGLVDAANQYLLNATGVTFAEDSALAKLFCRMLVADWYDNRGTVGSINTGARAILAQLRNSPPRPKGGTS